MPSPESSLYGSDLPLYRLTSLSTNYNRSEESIRTTSMDEREDEDEESSSLVGFAALSLRKYYQETTSTDDKSVFLSPQSARILMFKMAVSILTMDENSFVGRDGLISYAAESWSEYLLEDGGETPIDEQDVKTVVKGLASILSGKDRALQRMEYAVDLNDDCPSILGRSSEVITKTSEAIHSWARRAKQVDHSDFSESAKQLVHEVSSAPAQVLLHIARKHAENWLATEYPGEAYNCFRLAEQALYDGGYRSTSISPPVPGKSYM